MKRFNGSTYLLEQPVRKSDTANVDPNAELHSFEPLRVLLALGALLLGLVLSIH